MRREELLQALTDLGTIEDGAERRSRIAQIHDEVKGVFDQNETLTTSNAKLEDDKKKLQDYNMELYLKVGGQQKKEDPKPEGGELSYEKLFNEKGELL